MNTAAVEQPWHAVKQAAFDGLRQANVAAANIAQGRKPAIEARVHKLRREVREIRHRRLHNPGDVQSRCIHMHMGIDQSGHQDASATVDDLVTAGGGALRNLGDAIALDEDVDVRLQRFRLAVEDARRSKYDSWGHCRSPVEAGFALLQRYNVTESGGGNTQICTRLN